MDRINTELKEMAVNAGLCDKWKSEWSESRSTEKLLSSFKRGIDFYISNPKWVNDDYIKSHFLKTDLHDNGIYIDDEIDATLSNGVYILIGRCSGVLRFKKYSAATIYLFDSSNITIESDSNSKILVRLYNESDIHISKGSESFVRVLNRK